MKVLMISYIITINQFEHDCVICLFAVSHVYLIGLTKLVAREEVFYVANYCYKDLVHSSLKTFVTVFKSGKSAI